jgi:6-phosphogluconolactonase
VADTVKKGSRVRGSKGLREKNRKQIIIFKTIDGIADFVIVQWETLSEKAIKRKGYFSVALSGGKTPVSLYKKLSHKKKLPWDRTHIFMVDERFVPYENKENNFHMINNALLDHVSIPKGNIHHIDTGKDTPQMAAKQYELDLLAFFMTNANPPRFDLILLGIGKDGHTASLFPSAQAVKDNKHLAAAAAPLNKTGNERITITFPVINNAENIMFLVTGRRKAKIVKEVIDGKCDLCPASMVKPEKGKLFFLLDESAGSLLSGSKQACLSRDGVNPGKM